jgi:magnesium and cobalt transporter
MSKFGVAGMVTIEDVLEQIVGDIEDEYDYDEDEDNIIQDALGHYRVKALTEIADFNEIVGTQFSDEEFSTIGGLVVNKFGHLPKRGETVVIENLSINVLRADSRRLHSMLIEVIPGEHYPIEST